MRPKARYLGLIGSYGWGTKMTETMNSLTSGIKAERLEPLLVKGLPNSEDLANIADYAAKLAEKILAIPDLIT